jgi:uncharacterized protein
MRAAVVDTEPLVTFLDPAERITAASPSAEELDAPLLVCEPVLAEAMHLLARFSRAQGASRKRCAHDLIPIHEHISSLRKLHQKYREDRCHSPMRYCAEG